MANKSVPAVEWTCDGGCGLVKLVPQGGKPEGFHGDVEKLSNKTGRTAGTYWADKIGCIRPAILAVTGESIEDEQENLNAEPAVAR